MGLQLRTLGIPPASIGSPENLDLVLFTDVHRPPQTSHLVRGMAGIPCQLSSSCWSVGRTNQRGQWGSQIPSVASLFELTPWGHFYHINNPPGRWYSGQVLLFSPRLVSPLSPSGKWLRTRPYWISWGTWGRFAWHLGTPWTGVQSIRWPRPPWSGGPSTSKEVGPSWYWPRTLLEGLVPSPGLRCFRPSGYPERPWRVPPSSWT